MNFDNSDFSGKFVILFHNNMQVQYCWYSFAKEKPSKLMSSKDTHLITSDLAFRSLVFDSAG